MPVLYLARSSLLNYLSIHVNPLSSRPSAKPYNGANGCFNGVVRQNIHFLPILDSPSIPICHLFYSLDLSIDRIAKHPLHLQDDADPIGSKCQCQGSIRLVPPPSAQDSLTTRSDIPHARTLYTHRRFVFALLSPRPSQRSRRKFFPPLHPPNPPTGQLIPMNTRTDPPSGKKHLSSETTSFDRLTIGYTDIENTTFSRSFCLDIQMLTPGRCRRQIDDIHQHRR